jgi:uncharacterized OB-fold protein
MMDLSRLVVPGPTRTALTTPFWDAVSRRKFLAQACTNCGIWTFYPRQICPHCWSTELVWREPSGRGRLKTWSVIHRPGHPGWEPAAPYTIGLVELDEGPTMLSHLFVATPVLHMPLRVRFEPVGTGILPCFEPDE